MTDRRDRNDTYIVRVTGPAGDWQEWDLTAGQAGLTLDRLALLADSPTRYNVLNHVVGEEALSDDTVEWPRPLLEDPVPHSKEENIAFRKDWDRRVDEGKRNA